MQIIKERLDIEESLEKKNKTILKFLNIKSKIEKEKYNDKKFYLKYERENILNKPLKLIPILNKKGLNNITHYGVIEVPVLPSTIIKI